jgi:hypothetical protein
MIKKYIVFMMKPCASDKKTYPQLIGRHVGFRRINEIPRFRLILGVLYALFMPSVHILTQTLYGNL